MAGLVYTLAFIGTFLAWTPPGESPGNSQRNRQGTQAISVGVALACLAAAISHYGAEIGPVVFMGSAMVGGLAAVGIASLVPRPPLAGWAVWSLALAVALVDGGR